MRTKLSVKLDRKEKGRLTRLTKHEKAAYLQGVKAIAGVDEAGRGPLAGPLVVAVCMIEEGIFFPGVDDSKRLGEKAREKLFDEITNHPKVLFQIGMASHELIDQVNIHQASLLALKEAIEKMAIKPQLLLVDGLGLSYPTIPHQKIIGGDSKSQSIAAASIIAKVTRDRLMLELHELYPNYDFAKHKGYATETHRQAITQFGLCPIHRRSFII